MKVAIAHADRLAREALRRALAHSPFDLEWQADSVDGLARRVARSDVTLLLVDLALLGPRAEALPALLAPGRGVVVLAHDPSAPAAYEALGQGALALLDPPRLDDAGELIGAQRAVARLERLARLVDRNEGAVAATPMSTGTRTPVIALGASTGGPLALARVLRDLPADLPAAVLVVQHIEGEFSEGLAQWLSTHCALPVALAQRGDTPRAGRVYIAGPGGHLVLLPSQQFSTLMSVPRDLHVPSVDALFASLAQHVAPGAAALLTGMGSDGVAGMRALAAAGWLTIAQDEGSSAVYGMPRAAREAGVARQSLALDAIGPALVRHAVRSAHA
jgi:two-component system response regulator WspF